MVVRDTQRILDRWVAHETARLERVALQWKPYLDAWLPFEPVPQTEVIHGRKGAVDFMDLSGSNIGIAQQAEAPRNGFVVPKDYTLIDLVNKIDALPDNGHIDIAESAFSILPAQKDMPAHARQDPLFNQNPSREVRGDNFTRRGYALALRVTDENGKLTSDMTARDLARIVDGMHINAPQKLFADSLDALATRPGYRPLRGVVWHPVSGVSNRVMGDGDIIKAYQWAAPLVLNHLRVKLMAENGTPLVQLPSRHTPGLVYDVRFTNLPVGEQGYVDWNVLMHNTLSKQSVHAGKTTASKYEQTVFGFHQIAAYLIRGMRDTASKQYGGGTHIDDLPPLSVLPFPAPSEEKLRFERKLKDRMFIISMSVTENNDLSITHDHLNDAERQVLHSAWNAVHGSAGFVYSADSRFDRRYIRQNLEMVLAIK